MFHRLGTLIARRAGWLLFAWLGIGLAAGLWAWRAEPVPPADVNSILPVDHPWMVALKRMRQAFPRLDARSQIVVIVCREAGLRQTDLAWLGSVGDRVERELGFQVLSPTVSFLRHRLVSVDDKAALLVVNLPTGFISAASAQAVNRVDEMIRQTPPPTGLTAELTGTAGIGRDYAATTQRALHRTTWVTIVAVLTILILVYRSPFGAVVPLVCIGASVFVAFVLLALLARYVGWSVSAIERVFAIVLIFGMGVDFALFWIARYREELRANDNYGASAETATRTCGPAILVSAATTICGLTTMLVTQLTPTQNAGKVLAVALTVTLLAALTLAPAMARLLGRWLFWPTGYRGQVTLGQERVWPHVAGLVAGRPRLVLLVGLVLLGGPALWSATIEPRFDSMSEFPPGSSSLRGFNIANAHFEKGQLYSNNVLIAFASPPPSVGQLYELSRKVSQQIAAVPGVSDVYSLDAPLGRGRARTSAQMGSVLSWLEQRMQPQSAPSMAGALFEHLPGISKIRDMGEYVRSFYLSDRTPMLRFEVLIDTLPFSPEAMTLMQRVNEVVPKVVADAGLSGPTPEILTNGPTPYILAVRDISNADQLYVKVLASIVIAIIVFGLIRDLPLTLFMLAATWLTYGATIAATQVFFLHVLHEGGLDWKVQLIVFVLIVAVGQDYNVFLVSRLLQEPAELPDAEAARRAIIRTGSVISNCGLIMAATLGSLWVGQLGLLRQVGFALALGILLDTFFVRPLLLPSFFLATHRRRSQATVRP